MQKYKSTQTCKTHMQRLQIYGHTTHIYRLTHTKRSLSHTSARRTNKHADEALQAQNPFITSHCREDAEVAHQVLPSLYINP